MENNSNKRKYNRTLIFTLLFLTVTLVVTVVFYEFYVKGRKQDYNSEEYEEYYVMITDNRKSSFMQAVYAGAFEKGKEKSVYVDLLGDNLPSDYTEEDLFKMAIASEVDGIIVEADETEGMTELINEAVEKGIPVVTLINDNTQSARCSFVGLGGYNIGREYGSQITEIINSNINNVIKAKTSIAVLVNSSNQGAGQNIILSGLQETLDKQLGQKENWDISVVAVDNTNTFSVEESVRDLFMHDEIPDIIVALDELTTTCVYQAVVDYNVVGKVNILGYYDSDIIVNAISRGAIHSTIHIDTAQLGEYCVEALKEYNEMGTTSQYFTADVTLINIGNVSSYLKQEDEADAE